MVNKKFKFDVVIGNPPYQGVNHGGNKRFLPPIYHKFLEQAYKISNIAEFITPARFLFNAGATPKKWNRKMLSDKHLKVLFYEQKSAKVFSNVGISGGIAVTYRDANKDFGAIGTFIIFPELNSILKKVRQDVVQNGSLAQIIYSQNKFNLDKLNEHYIGLERTDKRLKSNVFKYDIFKPERSSKDDFKILGVIKHKRVFRYVNPKYIDNEDTNFDSYKVLVPKANGSGAFGEALNTSIAVTPLIGYTFTFIGIGSFKTAFEANSVLKYVKSKFTRAMLGTLKVTQDNSRWTWKNIPIQDFAANSDIDWSKSIHEIDQQLYKKYGLSEKEINFIESKVKEMD